MVERSAGAVIALPSMVTLTCFSVLLLMLSLVARLPATRPRCHSLVFQDAPARQEQALHLQEKKTAVVLVRSLQVAHDGTFSETVCAVLDPGKGPTGVDDCADDFRR